MKAKELVEAAEHVVGSPQHEWDAFAVSDIARHVLATVRSDDDEPVTRERLESDGWCLEDEEWSIGRFVKRLNLHVYQVQQSNDGFALCFPYRKLKSMGHLRRLVAALGE